MVTDKDKTIEEQFVDGEVLPEDIEDLLLDNEDDDKPFIGTEAIDEPPVGDEVLQKSEIETQAGVEIIDEEAEKKKPETEKVTETEKVKAEKAAETVEDGDGTESYFRGVYWKEQGYLPDDTELKTDLTAQELEELYYKATQASSIEVLKGQVNNRLQALGVKPDLVWGDEFNDQKLLERNFRAISDLSYDDLVEKAGDKLQDILKQIGGEYYFAKLGAGADEDEVGLLVDRDIDNNIEEDLYAKYSTFLGKKADQIQETIKLAQKSQLDDERAEMVKNRAYIEKQLSSGKIGNREFTKDEIQKISDGMYKKNQVYVDPYGGKHYVTLFEKKRLAARDDLDIQLSFATDLILGRDEKSIKEKSERVGSLNTLDRIANAAGSASASLNNTPKEKEKIAEIEEMFLDTEDN